MKIINNHGSLQIKQNDNRVDIVYFNSEYPDLNPSGWLICLEGVKIAKMTDFNQSLSYGIETLIMLSKNIKALKIIGE